MTDKDVIKALECCSHCECSNDKNETECPLYYMSFCRNYLRKQSLDLINRQQAEIERLNDVVERLQKHNRMLCMLEKMQINRIKAEAIKEFADKLKADINKTWYYELENDTHNARALKRVDELVKEMVGDDK